MKRAICIGDCALDIVFDGATPTASRPHGRIINAAAQLARLGVATVMASEASDDAVGDILVDFLEQAGVDTSSVDRFTQGRSPLMLHTADGAVTRYEGYCDEGFDIIWPRVDDSDAVLFGGYYTLDQRMRRRMVQFLDHCADRDATTIYAPGFAPQLAPRITRVMPEILDNLERADLVITTSADLRHIFGKDDPARCYHDHVDFYCRAMINIDDSGIVTIYSGNTSQTAETPCPDVPATIAAATKAVIDLGLTHEDLESQLPDKTIAALLAATTKQ